MSRLDGSGHGEVGRRLCAPNGAEEVSVASVDVIFDLGDPQQLESLAGFRSAFGDDHAEVVWLGEERILPKLHPGVGARGAR